MRQLLITGGAGFIGANFVHYWRHAHPDDLIVVLDALTYAGNRMSVPPDETPGFLFVRGDIRDTELVAHLLKEHVINTIVHFAAESHVDRSIHGPGAFVETNVIGTHSLLEAARQVWLRAPSGPKHHRFHHISTDEVYGSLGPGDPAFSENTPYAPNSPYAASKAASDHLVRAYHHTYGLDATTSNCSNNYGPFQFPEKLIPLSIVNLLEGRPLPVYGDGRNVRDWLHVQDHCRGIDHVLSRGRAGETYVIGGSNEWVNIDIVRLLCHLMDQAFAIDQTLARRFPAAAPANGAPSEDLITFVRDRPGHDRRYAIDPKKIRTELGFCPTISSEEGLRQTLDWYLRHELWWRAIIDGSYQSWIQQNYAA